MGGAATDAVWLFAAVLALIVLAAALLASRRFLLERSGGTVECALRRPASAGPAGSFPPTWRLGVLAYQRDELRWYGALAVLLRPEHVFQRRALTVVARRPATASESATLGADRYVVEIATKPQADSSGSPAGEHAELAMTEQALTGFLAWLEASPPGTHLDNYSLSPPAPPRHKSRSASHSVPVAPRPASARDSGPVAPRPASIVSVAPRHISIWPRGTHAQYRFCPRGTRGQYAPPPSGPLPGARARPRCSR